MERADSAAAEGINLRTALLHKPIFHSDFTPIHPVSASALDKCTSSALK